MNVPDPTFYPASPLAIRNGTTDRVKAITGYANVKAQRAMPVKDYDLPLASIWHGGDRTEPMGDANVGIPSFDHTLKITVVIAVTDDVSDDLDADLVAVTEGVRAALLTDPSWLALFEACTKADVGYACPHEGQLPYAHGIIEFEVTYRSEWPPLGGDDLTEIAVTASASPQTYFHQSFAPRHRT